ncbi:glycoside hydrolase family 10 protein [Pantanalinema sp. GBBB05]|uniref:glycoside hydrolase family 10 protein n=1 Tax=Pantanalinema sp. GBBB05 TaxID=2604139 RepID=UPI001D55961B|nr:family 10 glycosylhydrolase [Pantanalinema sp. GBBB05]
MWKFRRSQVWIIWVMIFTATLTMVVFSKVDVSVSAPAKFKDVQGHWAQNCIESLAQQRIINGYPDGTFRPNAPVTRAEFAVMVDSAFSTMSRIRPSSPFKDVPTSHWAAKAIEYTYQTGFLSGYPGGKFNPSEQIVRVQAIGALAGGLRQVTNQPASQNLSTVFNDAQTIPAYAKTEIAAALENRLIVNYPDVKRLNPNQVATRGEIAALFCRAQPRTAALIPNQYVASNGATSTLPPIVNSPSPTPSAINPPGTVVLPVSDTTVPPTPVMPTREIRGVWITNVDSEVLFEQNRLSNAIQDLAQLNFNTLYPAVWNWGYTLYPSAVAQRTMGVAYDPRPEAIGLQGRNILAEMVQQGHQRGLAVIPWFEFGFMAPEDSELARLHPDWLTSRQDNSQVWMEGIHPRVWLNPFKPEVQQFILDLVMEIVTQYDVDGIQFDDHFGLPYDFGYDAYTMQLYTQENPGKTPPIDPRDPDWVRWRANKITEFTRRVFQSVKARKRQAIVSLSPNAYPYAYEHSLQDWPTWQQQGLIEELLVQIYRDSLPSFIAELQRPSIQEARRRIPTGVGILTGLKDKPIPFQQIQEQAQVVRQQGFEGISFFFYETLWSRTGEPERDRKTAFKSLFSPSLPRPNLLANWTPPVQ